MYRQVTGFELSPLASSRSAMVSYLCLHVYALSSDGTHYDEGQRLGCVYLKYPNYLRPIETEYTPTHTYTIPPVRETCDPNRSCVTKDTLTYNPYITTTIHSFIHITYTTGNDYYYSIIILLTIEASQVHYIHNSLYSGE